MSTDARTVAEIIARFDAVRDDLAGVLRMVDEAVAGGRIVRTRDVTELKQNILASMSDLTVAVPFSFRVAAAEAEADCRAEPVGAGPVPGTGEDAEYGRRR